MWRIVEVRGKRVPVSVKCVALLSVSVPVEGRKLLFWCESPLICRNPLPSLRHVVLFIMILQVFQETIFFISEQRLQTRRHLDPNLYGASLATGRIVYECRRSFRMDRVQVLRAKSEWSSGTEGQWLNLHVLSVTTMKHDAIMVGRVESRSVRLVLDLLKRY